jgi:hypothetical protein
MVVSLFFASLAAAATTDKGYCEPCDDQLLKGIQWTSKNKDNNYELDGVTRRNDVYKVVVKQECASGFTGTATRVCTGNGEWQTPDLSGCVSDPCAAVPADFEDYKKIDNAAMKENCPADSPGQFECDVVCMPGFDPVSPKMRCLGGMWQSDYISCAPGATTPAPVVVTETETTTEAAVVTESEEPDNTDTTTHHAADMEGAVDDSSSRSFLPFVIIGGILCVLFVAGFFFYKRSKNGAATAVASSQSSIGSSRSAGHRSRRDGGSRRGPSHE